MLIDPDYKKLTSIALKENITAIEYCINFDKSNWVQPEDGCLGFPALILLCSVIDTIGSYFRKTKLEVQIKGESRKIVTAKEHFYILNCNKIFDLDLDETIIDAFYSKYRSKTTHNNTLPLNTSLAIGLEDENIFETNTKKELIQVRLKPLFIKVKEAEQKFSYYLANAKWSESHCLGKELEESKNLTFDLKMLKNPTITASTIPNNIIVE